MRKCVISGKAFAFGLGLLAGVILPKCWSAIVAAVLLVIVAFIASHCGRQC